MNETARKKAPDEVPDRSGDGRQDDGGTAASGRTGERAPREIGGRGGLDPVRYGDWEKDGRCIDF